MRPALLLTPLLAACAAQSDPSLAAPSGTSPAAAFAPAEAMPEAATPALAATQIDWQRSVSDALALAREEGRAILVAINVDGESASDRIVTERYRDPEFVAWTRRFVCVIGHPFRHVPFDRDESGRRIPCPRLGGVTCGEHVALEPELFERWLGGERVSPRHALVDLDGTKRFDLYYLFDLGKLDRALAAAAAQAEPPTPAHDVAAMDLDQIAVRRDARSRSELERRAFLITQDGERAEVARAIGEHGDAGSLEALLALALSLPVEVSWPKADQRIEPAARALGIERALASELRSILDRRALATWSPGVDFARAPAVVRLIARCADSESGTRTWLLAMLALGDGNQGMDAGYALRDWLGEERVRIIDEAIQSEGGPVDLSDIHLQRGVAESAERPSAEPEKSADELLAQLELAERALTERPEDPRAARAFGMTCLKLAELRVRERASDAGFYVEDAWTWLERAASGLPDDDELALARARTAWMRSDFRAQERVALEVLGRRGLFRPTYAPEPDPQAQAPARDWIALEASRWLGDACARLAPERAQLDALEEVAGIVRGARAFDWVASSEDAGAVDHLSLASFLGLLGQRVGERAVLRASLLREPHAQELRDAARDAFVRNGQLVEFGQLADGLLSRDKECGTCAWYAGYAWILAAEAARRACDPGAALDCYGRCSWHFRRSIALEPQYADSADHYRALAELGSGFASTAAGDRIAASHALVAALRLRPAIGEVRDGLDRDALDLVDGVLEWRKEGESPVSALDLAGQLGQAVPGEPRWLQAVADAELREALRADGRSTERIELPPELAWMSAEGAIDAPAEGGDRHMAHSIEVAGRALAVADTEATRFTLAQSLAVQAERLLARGRDGDARPLVIGAARQLGLAPPASDATRAELAEAARELRARLGPARPVARPGR